MEETDRLGILVEDFRRLTEKLKIKIAKQDIEWTYSNVLKMSTCKSFLIVVLIILGLQAIGFAHASSGDFLPTVSAEVYAR